MKRPAPFSYFSAGDRVRTQCGQNGSIADNLGNGYLSVKLDSGRVSAFKADALRLTTMTPQQMDREVVFVSLAHSTRDRLATFTWSRRFEAAQ